MFTKIEFSNIGCYNRNIVLDFSISKRDKTNIDSYTTLKDGTEISNIVGIIGGNAFGKSTILEMLNRVGSFIDGPLKKREISKITEEHKDDLSETHKKYLEYIIKNSYTLPSVNKSKKEKARILLEMFLESLDEELEGYYTYIIEYDEDYRENGVILEKLEYRKKYKSTKNTTIFEVFNNHESEIGYKLAYKENIKTELKDAINIEEFDKKLKRYKIFHEHYTSESSTIDAIDYDFDEDDVILYAKDNMNILERFIKTVDSDIDKVLIEDLDTNNPKLYALYKEDYKIRYGSLSTATKKICLFACDYIRSQKKKGIILIDELDNSFNMKIVQMILTLFKRKSPNKSQLIFTTNNPEALNDLRKDQIFIITKVEGKNNCIKFSDYIDPKTKKKVRNDFSFEKAYKHNNILNQPDETKVEELINYINEIY